MKNRRSQYTRAIRRLEDFLLECLGNPIEENWNRLRLAREFIPELDTLGIGIRTIVEKLVPPDAAIILVESFSSIRHDVPDEVVVYVVPTVGEGDVGIRSLYFSRLSEV
ncbi:MAG: hypothetical protein ABIH23_25970 [bacterium]